MITDFQPIIDRLAARTLRPGDAVDYWPSEHDQYHAHYGRIQVARSGVPCHAVVAFAHSDALVNVLVTDHFGNQRSRHKIPVLRDGATPEAGRAYCSPRVQA